ncbi:lytic murein transglycosylase [Taibaiella sp. KBW10]|uniref:lytic transglycosylase domain-containing protein n=1 Tax=Taibaiella sp. KBW10 TaxID=2153357 RepID=UPI000F5A26CE|nr:lytic transglycosylase domain-containing protein [Taibaiella sp. KBW10]RQO29738.1 lytic murein transglycosylase [Taibaiella sp. KBW10]
MKKLLAYIIGMVALLSFPASGTQFNGLFQVSADQANYYRSVIRENKEIVQFIEHTLTRNGLPRMLRNLALIESGFNKQSVSSAQAGGVWQFTTAHSDHYGLQSKDRFDIYKSTQTVVKSLKDLYAKYHDWVTVVAAYNCGEGNVDKAMRTAQSDRYHLYYTYLPKETIGHVRKFIAACQATNELSLLQADYHTAGYKIKSPRRQNTKGHPTDPSLTYCEVNGAFDTEVIIEVLNISAADFNRWNPSVKTELQEKGIARIYLPVDLMPDFQLQKNVILSRSLKKEIPAHE